MKKIYGLKGRMTQIFDESGKVHPVTQVIASPLVVTQIKTIEKDGYSAIQVGFGTQKEQRIKKPQRGHMKDLGLFRYLKEFAVPADQIDVKVGDTIDLSVFENGEKVSVTSISKGKGFQGVVKRWNFAGGPRTHGQKHTERAPGSIGATGPQRVFKGTKMGGRMGTDRVTVKNLIVVDTDAETNTIFIRGAVPGRPGALVEINA